MGEKDCRMPWRHCWLPVLTSTLQMHLGLRLCTRLLKPTASKAPSVLRLHVVWRHLSHQVHQSMRRMPAGKPHFTSAITNQAESVLPCRRLVQLAKSSIRRSAVADSCGALTYIFSLEVKVLISRGTRCMCITRG